MQTSLCCHSLFHHLDISISFRYQFGMRIIHSNHKLWKAETDLSSLDVLSSLLYSCTQTAFFSVHGNETELHDN